MLARIAGSKCLQTPCGIVTDQIVSATSKDPSDKGKPNHHTKGCRDRRFDKARGAKTIDQQTIRAHRSKGKYDAKANAKRRLILRTLTAHRQMVKVHMPASGERMEKYQNRHLRQIGQAMERGREMKSKNNTRRKQWLERQTNSNYKQI